MVEEGLNMARGSKLFVLLSAIVTCLLIAFYASFVAHTTSVYTHLFYIPILLAGIWYQRKAVYVALFLGIVHILVTYIYVPDVLSAREFARAAIFLVVAYAVGYVSEREVRKGKALQESHEHLRRIIDGSSIPAFVINSEHKITHWNTALEALTRVKKEEVVGTDKHWLLYPEKRPVMADFVVDGVSERKIREFYGNRYNKASLIEGAYEGVEFFPSLGEGGKWLLFTAAPLKDSEGDIIGAIETLQDVTDRKKAEKGHLELISELERANEELRNFVYVASHDLKSPLRAIHSLAEWMKTDYADKLDETGKERLDLMMNRAKRMHRLIGGILRYSRIGRMEVERDEVNLNELVSEVINTIKPLVKDIDIEVAAQLPTIHCDKTLVGSVFQNLLTNAVRYMDKPKGRVTIGCTDEDGYWKFSVADNGQGIDDKYHDKIFQIFQTLHPRDEVESTGIGLSIVKKIVETQGGEIWLESKVGEGSTFFFTVPK